MALQIMKLLVNVNAETITAPTVDQFFNVTSSDTAAGTSLTIDATDFFDNTGTEAAELPVLSIDNSYFKVYINGVPQMEGILTYTPGGTGVGSLEIAVPVDSEPILAGSPIVLEVVNYAPATTTDVAT